MLPCIAAPVMHPAPRALSSTYVVDRLTRRANLFADDSNITLAGSYMARFASWCEREQAHVCWQSRWNASLLWPQSRPCSPFPFVDRKLPSLAAPLKAGAASVTVLSGLNGRANLSACYAGWRNIHLILVGTTDGDSSRHARASTFQNNYASWDLSSMRNMMRASFTYSVAALLNTLAPLRPVVWRLDAPPTHRWGYAPVL